MPEAPEAASVLIVDDEPLLLRGLQRVFTQHHPEWRVRTAGDAAAALKAMDQEQADVCVSDLTMTGMDGIELLTTVAARWPATVRVILAGDVPRDRVPAAARVAHRVFRKGPDPMEVVQAVEDALSAFAPEVDPALRGLVARDNELPPAPSVYPALDRAARRQTTTTQDLTRIVARDSAVAARVLQLASSAFYGLPPHLHTLQGAVAWLGLQTLRGLVLGAELLRAFPEVEASGLSVNRLANHTTRTGELSLRIARRLCPTEADTAYMAGIVHDVGLLVLASRAPDRLHTDLQEARRERRALHEVERDRHGVTHAEVGAALVGLWGLPKPLIDAVSRHHQRPVRPDAAAVVYLANALVAEVEGHGVDPLTEADLERVCTPSDLERFRRWANMGPLPDDH
ncbi:MAG: HDOD domain-containing protein [Myxococcales bacterium]|nr:HDOD domain-containing protein [Myxococcales bacterium]